MCSAWDNVALPTLGFPIRRSAGQWLFSASPRLIAAVHVLLRLLVPRHPPCALNILTVSQPTPVFIPKRASYPLVSVTLPGRAERGPLTIWPYAVFKVRR